MAAIGNARIESRVIQTDFLWEFTIRYTAFFTPDDLKFEFDESAKLYEESDGDMQEIMPYLPTVRFKPTAGAMERSFVINANEPMLDTELGHEEIKGRVWLRRAGSEGAADDERFTDNFADVAA
jgi:hypothetical protein